MLNFDYLQPPAIVQPAEIESTDGKPAELTACTSWWQVKRKRRRDVPIENRTADAKKHFRKRQEAKAQGISLNGIRKHKKRVRPILFDADPHCSVCRTPLQMISARLPNFACVVLPDEVLCCPRCFPTNNSAD